MIYELKSFEDVFNKVPAERIEVCMKEITALITQAKATRTLANSLGLEIEFPEILTWTDDDKGEVCLEITDDSGELLLALDSVIAHDERAEVSPS